MLPAALSGCHQRMGLAAFPLDAQQQLQVGVERIAQARRP
jgi:hypothetical protein